MIDLHRTNVIGGLFPNQLNLKYQINKTLMSIAIGRIIHKTFDKLKHKIMLIIYGNINQLTTFS